MNYSTASVLSLFLFLSLLLPAAAQDEWEVINRKPQTGDLYDLLAVTRNRVVGVGQLGTIRVTEDGGTTFLYPASGTEQALRGVAFFDSSRGLAVGAKGTILRTADGGKSWSPVSAPVADDLLAVATDGGMHAVAVGTNGALAASGDGGETWVVRSAGITDTLSSVAGSAGGVFLVVGKNGVLRSADRGTSWQVRPEGAEGGWQGAAAAGGVWWITGTAGRIYRSQDDGLTWERVNAADNTFRYQDISFYAANEGVRSGYAGNAWNAPFRIEFTQDGGETWQAAPGLDFTLGDPAAVVGPAISFPDATVGFSAGIDGSMKRHGRSGPESSFNSTILSGYTSYVWTDISCADEINCVAVGYRQEFGHGEIRPHAERTTDGGATWRELAHTLGSGRPAPPQTPVFNSVYCFDAERGIVVGDSGLFLRMTEGGTKLERENLNLGLNRPIFFNRLGFREGRGSMVTGGDLVLSDDGGATWRADSLSPYNLRIPARPAPDRILVSSPYYFHRSTDNGGSWSTEDYRPSLPEEVIFSEIDFTDRELGWIAASRSAGNAGQRMNSVLLETTDGGASWSTVLDRELPGAEFGLRAFDMADAQHGIAMGTRGSAYHTTDYGVTWSPLPLPIASLFSGSTGGFAASALSFPVPHRAIAVSAQGEMLRYNGVLSGVEDESRREGGLRILSLVPNPMTDGSVVMTVSLPADVRRGDLAVTLFDLVGREVPISVASFDSGDRVRLELDAGDLPPGHYIVRVSAGGAVASRPIQGGGGR